MRCIVDIKFITIIMLGLLYSLLAGAENRLPAPEGRIILEVSGNTALKNQGESAVFDYDMLASLQQNKIVTETPWTDDKTTFEGPLFSDLVKRLKAGGNTVKVTALNDYAINIKISDWIDNGVLLAIKQNGKPISIRKKGPIWAIYPWSDRSELRAEVHYQRSVWQIKSLEFK